MGRKYGCQERLEVATASNILICNHLVSFGKLREFLAELQRTKCASEAPWVRKIGNPSSRENLVMMLTYERVSVRTDSGGGEGASRDIPHGHPYGKIKNATFPYRFFV